MGSRENEAGVVRQGKFFILRLKSHPSLVVGVEDNSRAPRSKVRLTELQILSVDSNDALLWYFDQFSRLICNKSTGFAISSTGYSGCFLKFFLKKFLFNASDMRFHLGFSDAI